MSAARPDLDLVVVHRDEPRFVVETVRLFLDQGVAVRVLVVDNGSPPEHLAQVKASLPDGVSVLPLGENRGFGPAANAGFRWFLDQDRGSPGGPAGPGAGGPSAGPAGPSADGPGGPGAEWLAVAPHDARPASDCVKRLLSELARRPRAGLASADVGDGFTPVVDRYIGAIPTPARVREGWEPAGYPHGTLMLARRACLEEVGLFDERYFAYCEEADLALRAAAKGWQIGVVRGAEVRNAHVSSHVAVVDYLQLRNTLLLVREHFGLWPMAMRMVMALWQLAVGLVVPTRRGPYWHPRARLLALRDFLRGRYGPHPSTL